MRSSPSVHGGTPLHGSRPPPTPTTLGSSNGQVAGTVATKSKKAGWLIAAAVLVAGGGGAAIAIGVGGASKSNAAAPTTPLETRAADAQLAAPAPDAPAIAITPPDAPVAPAIVFDAAPPPD